MRFSDRLLILFVKNRIPGQVKTRLARTLGDDYALKVYDLLRNKTKEEAQHANADRVVFYSDHIEPNDEFEMADFRKFVQQGSDLGARMADAFRWGFEQGYEKVVIIGSDCYELNTDHLEQAFYHLDQKQAVIGPAKDGGYYLLGTTSMADQLFEDKAWSSDNVLVDTILDFQKLNWTFEVLDTLSDVDYEEDLGPIKDMIA